MQNIYKFECASGYVNENKNITSCNLYTKHPNLFESECTLKCKVNAISENKMAKIANEEIVK